MAKRKFKLTEAERKELLQAYRVCKDAATRTRYQAVRLSCMEKVIQRKKSSGSPDVTGPV